LLQEGRAFLKTRARERAVSLASLTRLRQEGEPALPDQSGAEDDGQGDEHRHAQERPMTEQGAPAGGVTAPNAR